MRPTSTLDVVVSEKRRVASAVVIVEFRAVDGRDLPEWSPGAHIDLFLPNDLQRQYSLCGDHLQSNAYQIAVLKASDGRGGSSYVHDVLMPGQRLTIGLPRNAFPFVPAPRHLFIAGGIGITPLLPMMARATTQGSDWALWYGGRSRRAMAFADELTQMYGRRVNLWPQDEKGHLPLADVLAQGHREADVYCCGPEPLLDAIAETFARHPLGSLHIERFAPRADRPRDLGAAFRIQLARSGVTLDVPSDRTVIDVLSAAGIAVLSSCREGMCGSCEVAVLEGDIDHRDTVLTQEEQDAGDTMMVCVSRALGSKLVLDL